MNTHTLAAWRDEPVEENELCDDLVRRRGRPRKLPSDAQCQQIVETARRLFVEKGYGATTTDDITAACHISKQTLYRFYPSKAAMFAAVIAAERNLWLRFPVDEEQPIAAGLADIFRLDLDEEAERRRLGLQRLVLIEERQYPELREIKTIHGGDVSLRALVSYLAGQAARGRLRQGDYAGYARMLSDMVFGPLLKRGISLSETPDRAERRAHLLACIDLFLHGAGA